MNMTKEITKIIEYQNSTLLLKDRKSETAINTLIHEVVDDYNNENFDFTKYKEINIKKMSKIRRTKSFEPFSCEEILCIYLKRILDRKFHFKYPNRNEYIHSLFDIISVSAQ